MLCWWGIHSKGGGVRSINEKLDRISTLCPFMCPALGGSKWKIQGLIQHAHFERIAIG
jgi:hypothetical protein